MNLSRTWLLGLVVLIAVIAGVYAYVSDPKTVEETVLPKTEELWITNNGRKLYGVLSRPDSSEEKQPLAIIAHGFNGTHDFGKNYFEPLNLLGYQCFTFDFACGSVNSRSDNNTMNMSILDEQSDLEAIINYFRSCCLCFA